MNAARKPKWKRKLWIPTAAIWLALPILYPLSMGPAVYAWCRNWVSIDAVLTIYSPLAEVERRCPPIQVALGHYIGWWNVLALRHAGEHSIVPNPEYLIGPAHVYPAKVEE